MVRTSASVEKLFKRKREPRIWKVAFAINSFYNSVSNQLGGSGKGFTRHGHVGVHLGFLVSYITDFFLHQNLPNPFSFHLKIAAMSFDI